VGAPLVGGVMGGGVSAVPDADNTKFAPRITQSDRRFVLFMCPRNNPCFRFRVSVTVVLAIVAIPVPACERAAGLFDAMPDDLIEQLPRTLAMFSIIH